MLSRLRDLFAPQEKRPEETAGPERLRLATCVLMLEAARADEEFSDDERRHIIGTLETMYALSEREARELLDASRAARDESSDLWHFTRQINETCSNDEKVAIIEQVWRVVYTDGTLDGHEDYLMHILANLLNLTHPQLIDAKMKVLGEVRGKS